MTYTAKDIRNICLLGHRGNGKTTLVETLLYWNGKTDRFGTIAQGNTVCDYDPEEIRRKTSVTLSIAHIEQNNTKVNLIDSPGFYDFEGENISAATAADAALIVVSAKQSVSVGAEKAVGLTRRLKKAKAFYISFLDDEHADYYSTIEQLNEKFRTNQICPIWLPIYEAGKPVGIVDVLTERAIRCSDGKSEPMDMPADILDNVALYKDKVRELIAETSDELLEKYFNSEEFTQEEILTGTRAAIAQRLMFPVVCGIPGTMFGINELAEFFVNYMPTVHDAESPGLVEDSDKPVQLYYNEGKPAAIHIFKTVVDPFVGKLSFFKVISGTLSKDDILNNVGDDTKEKFARIYVPMGKKQVEVEDICAGDIGVVSKLGAATGDVLRAKGSHYDMPEIKFPTPNYVRAIAPVTKGEEERMTSGIMRMMEQDPTLKLVNNKETKQTVIYGMGDTQLDILINRLAEKPFSVKVALSDARVAYRETIRKKVKVEGKHKKQSGGHGQYGHVWIEFEPTDKEFEFSETVFGGSVPKNYFPAVEKGLRESVQTGVLAGYPVTGVKATLTDGSYHPVDSSEMAFKIAASLAFKEGMKQASPTMLEPIGRLAVNVSDALMGDIIGDINKRRGQVLSMDAAPEYARKIVEADVPMSEMNDYAMALRSMTHGRATFEFNFLEYREAPMNIIEKVIKENAQE